jgi:hypothetical protein
MRPRRGEVELESKPANSGGGGADAGRAARCAGCATEPCTEAPNFMVRSSRAVEQRHQLAAGGGGGPRSAAALRVE